MPRGAHLSIASPRPGARRLRAAAALLAALPLVVWLAGCAAPVDAGSPSPDPSQTTICSALLAALPNAVLDEPRRPTTSPLTAAWGSPVITLACGVPMPAGAGPTSECLEVNKVGWYAEQADGGVIFTTLGRAVPVEVRVPTHYRPEANALVDVAAAITDHDPLHTPCVAT